MNHQDVLVLRRFEDIASIVADNFIREEVGMNVHYKNKA
jgi:hypothetical protein